MAGVAVFAVIFATIAGLRNRRDNFHRIALFHAREAEIAADRGWGFQGHGIDREGRRFEGTVKNAGMFRIFYSRGAAQYWTLCLHHKSLKEKYEVAAHRPWLPIAPDPPEPKW